MECNVSDKLYIDRTAAIMTAMNYDGNGNAQDASQDIASALGGILAVDVVEVVRCKDCVHYDKGENDSESWMYCKVLAKDVSDDFFCKLGKRREVQHDD